MLRTRTNDERTILPCRVKTTRGDGTTPPPDDVWYLSPGIGTVSTILDSNHVGYGKNRNKHIAIMGDVHLERVERSADLLSFTAGPFDDWYHGGSQEYSGDWIGAIEGVAPQDPIAGDIAKMRDVMLIKAYAKMNSSDLLTGEFLNDIKTTISMLRKPLSGAQDLLTRMRKYRGRLATRTAKQVVSANANTWLEYRYGWKPLLSDIDKIIWDRGNVAAYSKPLLFVARAGTERKNSASKSFSQNAAGTWLVFEGDVTAKFETRVSAGVIYEVKSHTTSEGVVKFLGTRTTDLAPTFWETIPYSFVADWFVNVGDWLRAVSPNPSVTVKGNWVTTVTKTSTTFGGGTLRFTWPGHLRTGSYGGSHKVVTHYDRVCNGPLPNAPVVLGELPSGTHLIDGLGLILQKIITGVNVFHH